MTLAAALSSNHSVTGLRRPVLVWVGCGRCVGDKHPMVLVDAVSLQEGQAALVEVIAESFIDCITRTFTYTVRVC